MKHKIRALKHLSQNDRVMVLQWCRDYEEELTRLRAKCEDYETEISYMKRQSVIAGDVEVGDDALISRVVRDVTAALKRANKCHLYYSIFGKFKILTQPERIRKESKGSVLVGVYVDNFDRERLFKELRCITSHAKGTVAP